MLTNVAGKYGIQVKEAERFVKFLFVGSLGFALDFGTLTFLVELVKVPERVTALTGFPETVGLLLANTVSFSLAVLSNFTLNRYWTYPESRSKRKRIQLPQFTFVSVLGLALNNAILGLTHNPFDRVLASIDLGGLDVDGYIPAKILATLVVLFWNFFVNRYWTYGNVR
ncbi:MAG: GtrA family protein [Candidatus Promineifilaceae bacterium]